MCNQINIVCAKISKRNVGCAKELTFRKSALPWKISIQVDLSKRRADCKFDLSFCLMFEFLNIQPYVWDCNDQTAKLTRAPLRH